MTHDDLVRRAERWLLNSEGCVFALTDHLPRLHGEMPDALGFKLLEQNTKLVEVKMSRSDFFADSKKPWRANPQMGMGAFRYYLCPPEVIYPEDLPDRWRLLWCYPNQIRRVYDPQPARQPDFPERNKAYEVAVMEDALSALQKKLGPFSEVVKPKSEEGLA